MSSSLHLSTLTWKCRLLSKTPAQVDNSRKELRSSTLSLDMATVRKWMPGRIPSQHPIRQEVSQHKWLNGRATVSTSISKQESALIWRSPPILLSLPRSSEDSDLISLLHKLYSDGLRYILKASWLSRAGLQLAVLITSSTQLELWSMTIQIHLNMLGNTPAHRVRALIAPFALLLKLVSHVPRFPNPKWSADLAATLLNLRLTTFATPASVAIWYGTQALTMVSSMNQTVTLEGDL